MKTIVCTLEGISPYSQSRYYEVPSLPKESSEAKERRTWRERMHVDKNGNVLIPPMAFKNCVSSAAKYLSVRIPGKGKATYTKHFEAGVLVTDPLVLPVKKDDVEGLWLFVPSDGKRGGSKRVWKCFPLINSWRGEVTFYILDETVTKDVLVEHLEEAGKFVGLGYFRPQNNGYFGRFRVVAAKEISEPAKTGRDVK